MTARTTTIVRCTPLGKVTNVQFVLQLLKRIKGERSYDISEPTA